MSVEPLLSCNSIILPTWFVLSIIGFIPSQKNLWTFLQVLITVGTPPEFAANCTHCCDWKGFHFSSKSSLLFCLFCLFLLFFITVWTQCSTKPFGPPIRIFPVAVIGNSQIESLVPCSDSFLWWRSKLNTPHTLPMEPFSRPEIEPTMTFRAKTDTHQNVHRFVQT